MLWLILASAAAPPPPPAKPLLSYEDYPAEALRNHWEGKVIADLTISPEGKVSACKIVKSSGHQILDDATCNIMIKRARFAPARDSNGNPVEDHFRTPPVNWEIR
jgi:protein TonB